MIKNRGRGISALALTAVITGGIFFGGPVASSADPGGGRGGGPTSSASSSASPSGAPSSDPGNSGGGGGDTGGTRGAGGGNGAGNGNGGGNGASGSVSSSSGGGGASSSSSGGGGASSSSSSNGGSGGRGGGGSAGSQGDNSQGQSSSQTSQSSQGGGSSSQSTGSSGRGGSNSGSGGGNGNGSKCTSSCHTGQQTGTATFTPAPNLSTSGTTLAVTPSTTATGSGSGSGSKGSATKPIQLPPTIITVPTKRGHGKSVSQSAAAVGGALGAGSRVAGSRSPSTVSGTGLAGLLGGLPISTPATAANRFHHSSSGKGTPAFITRPAPSDGPNVIQRIERVVPVAIWIAMGLALLAAAAGGASALWSRRRVRRHANKFAEISAAAVTDPLTGVLNRRGFGDAVERELARARRYDRPFVLAYVDVRGMKAVNDSEGHRAGDELLRTAAQLLKDSARENDVVGRLGGDEMGILLVEVNDDGASAVRRRIQDRVTERREAMGFHSHWDLTIGTAAFPQDGETLDELLSTADRRLYEQRGIALLYDDDRR